MLFGVGLEDVLLKDGNTTLNYVNRKEEVDTLCNCVNSANVLALCSFLAVEALLCACNYRQIQLTESSLIPDVQHTTYDYTAHCWCTGFMLFHWLIFFNIYSAMQDFIHFSNQFAFLSIKKILFFNHVYFSVLSIIFQYNCHNCSLEKSRPLLLYEQLTIRLWCQWPLVKLTTEHIWVLYNRNTSNFIWRLEKICNRDWAVDM